MRKLVIGDIHGGYRAMLQVLDRAKFNPQEDMLIGLGDYADGWPEVYEVIKYLKELPNFRGVIGNHDVWLLDFLSYGYAPHIWLSQGGMASFKSYQGILNSDLSENHRRFLSSLPYYLEIDDKLFLHGGLNVSTISGINIREQRIEDLIWNRELFQDIAYAVKYSSDPSLNISPYKEIYIGHTTTQMVQPDFTPVFGYNVYLLDQGAGWDGKLTVMDIDTKEWWQSDFVPELYPEVKGRR